MDAPIVRDSNISTKAEAQKKADDMIRYYRQYFKGECKVTVCNIVPMLLSVCHWTVPSWSTDGTGTGIRVTGRVLQKEVDYGARGLITHLTLQHWGHVIHSMMPSAADDGSQNTNGKPPQGADDHWTYFDPQNANMWQIDKDGNVLFAPFNVNAWGDLEPMPRDQVPASILWILDNLRKGLPGTGAVGGTSTNIENGTIPPSTGAGSSAKPVGLATGSADTNKWVSFTADDGKTYYMNAATHEFRTGKSLEVSAATASVPNGVRHMLLQKLVGLI